MTVQNGREKVKHNSFTILDGAMGTMLQAAGMPAGHQPELLNIENPELIEQIGKKYIEAGSDIIYANTFGANRHKLKGADVGEVITAGIKAAKRAAEGTSVKVALDIGPIGQLTEPLGTLTFDEAYDIFREMVTAGERAGADIIVFETMSDLYEAKAGVLAAKENTSLPVWVTMTFEKTGRTFLGVTVPAMALTLSGLGVDALGFNCSLGASELLPMVRELAEWCDLPIILKPNAGLPDPESGEYLVSPERFAAELEEAMHMGASILGGCCGTTPDFIAAIKAVTDGASPAERAPVKHRGVCSGTRAVEFSGVKVIGERINPTGKPRLQVALAQGKLSYILERGIEQEDAGADILDVNVGVPGIDEPETMENVIKGLQSVLDLPLQIDSSDPLAIEAGLRYYNGRPIVNSVNGSEKSLKTILPICKKYGAAVVGLAMDDGGIPKSAKGRVEIAERILKAALALGIPREDVIIDCLTLTVSAEQGQVKETLDALRYVSKELALHTTLGVSNISFGLPERESITLAFLTEAMAAGLDMPIVNPNQRRIMDAVYAHRVLSGEDASCSAYIKRFSDGVTLKEAAPDTDITIALSVERGLRAECARLTRALLAKKSAVDVINGELIPALDSVGKKYEAGVLFLPQLISAANAACGGFDAVKESIARSGEDSISRGKIIVATVKGDIHDIGKNIVKVILENYGYTVIDLGRDVMPEIIVSAAIKENVELIGLSALMTTTVPAMEETIRALRESGHKCKIWVGGAVLNYEYAMRIGADFYAEDAAASVNIAKEVLG